MKKEYDFSQARKGQFYKKGADLRTPIHLAPELELQFLALLNKNS